MSEENKSGDVVEEAPQQEAVETAPVEEAVQEDPTIGTDFFDLGVGDDVSIPEDEPQVGDGNQEKVLQSESEEEMASKEDPSRYEHWQSKFDKENARASQLENELAEMQQQMADFKEMKPMVDLLKQPGMYEKIAQSVTGESPQEVSAEPQEQLKRPERPVKPSNYDPIDAVSDPESESFKYRQSMEEFNAEVSEYTLKIDEQREQEVQRSQGEAQYRSFISDVRGEVVKYGVPTDKVDDFIESMSSDNSLTIENLAKIYMLNNGLLKMEDAKTPPPKTSTSEAEVPLPASLQSGEAQDEPDDQALFNMGLFS